MCRLTVFFGAQSLTCSAPLATCQELAEMFAPDFYVIEGAAE